MKRLLSPGLLVPLLLGLAGVALIIASQLDLDGEVAASLPPIVEPTTTVAPSRMSPTPAASAPASGSHPASPSVSASPTPAPTFHSTGVAVQIQIQTAPQNINLPVRHSTSNATDSDPPVDAAYILSSSSQPGRGTNSYIFAHARNIPIHLFLNLWNVQLGAQVLVKMSDGQTFEYRVTEVHPNVACPDPDANPRQNPRNPPLALQIQRDCSEGGFWVQPTDHERLTLQTSQGYNRNWGEFVVVAEPVLR
jgi:hypothetical protein